MAEIGEVIALLDEEDALFLGESSWGTYDENETLLPLDWDRLFPRGGLEKRATDEPWENERLRPLEAEFEAILGNQDIGEESFAPSGTGGWDTCAWYQPIHFFGSDWGIFVRENCMIDFAMQIARHADRAHVMADRQRHGLQLAPTFIRTAFLLLYYHEHFHHRIECLGLRLHVALRHQCYPEYSRAVYRPALGTDDLLEEALASAHSYLALVSRRALYLRPSIRDAARVFLMNHLPRNPPGYRKAVDYLSRDAFRDGENLLQGQVKEGVRLPVQPPWQWNVAPRLTQGFFDIRSNIWTVIAPGQMPVLPTAAVRYTCSTADMIKLYRAEGYIEDRSSGKGSHTKLKKSGRRPMILPRRSDLSPGVLNTALKELGGYRPEDLPALLRRI